MLTAKLVGHNKPGSDYPRDCLICIQSRGSAQDDDDDDDVPVRIEPSRVVSLPETREIEEHARVSCMSSSASHIPPGRRMRGALNVDGTTTTMGALARSPIPSRGIASYFRFVTRLTNQRTAVCRASFAPREICRIIKLYYYFNNIIYYL